MTASRFFVVGIESTKPSNAESAVLEAHPPSGVILFARNFRSEPQVRSLVAAIRNLVPGVLLFVDQEGGRVDRFRGITGESISLARARAVGLAREAGRLAGEVCAAFDFDVDLAPVVDRCIEGLGKAILGTRCASGDPEEIVEAARAFIAGLAEFGILSSLKHFPGLGRGAVDSHETLPAIDADARQQALDMRPFEALKDESPAVVVSHAAVDGSRLPGTLDFAVASTLLRETVGFAGTAISDDLEMRALSEFGGIAKRSALAFEAGCDLLIVSREIGELPEAAALVGRAPASRIAQAERRILALRDAAARLRKGRREPGTVAEMLPRVEALREAGLRVEV
jgi:beta-N-acetylhexosaminidase